MPGTLRCRLERAAALRHSSGYDDDVPIVASDTFVVTPSLPTTIFMLLTVVAWIVGGPVTAAKGRWGWLFFGLLLTGGLAWIVSAFLAPRPASFWDRRRTRSVPVSS